MAAARAQNGKQALQHLPFLRHLGAQELAELGQHVRERRFERNEVILFEEDAANFMYIVASGRVKVVQTSVRGKEKILAIHRKGEYFGEMAMLDGKAAPATVIAMEHTVVGIIGRDDFEQHFLGDVTILQKLNLLLCDRLREAWLMLRIASFADAEQKVRGVLHHLGTLHGVRESRGIILAIGLTKQEIASYASLSRETVSRIMNRLAGEGEIESLEGRKVLLLQKFLDNAHEL